MEPLSATMLSALAKAVLAQVGRELGDRAGRGATRRVFGDPEQRAMERALDRAYTTTRGRYRRELSGFDVNPDFLRLEPDIHQSRPAALR